MRVLWLLLLIGCAQGTLPPRPRAGDPNSKSVLRLVYYTSPSEWQGSGYWRMDDPPGAWPWLVVVSGDGTVCAEFSQIVNEPRQYETWVCSTQWRVRRPG